jgi:hypothetical protein
VPHADQLQAKGLKLRNEAQMSEERKNRLIVRQESPPGKRKPIIRREAWRSKGEINSLADKVAQNSSLMQLFDSARGSNDDELASRALEKVREEVRQSIRPPPTAMALEFC